MTNEQAQHIVDQFTEIYRQALQSNEYEELAVAKDSRFVPLFDDLLQQYKNISPYTSLYDLEFKAKYALSKEMKSLLLSQGWVTTDGMENRTRVKMLVENTVELEMFDMWCNWNKYGTLTRPCKVNPIQYNVRLLMQDEKLIGYLPKGNRTRYYRVVNPALVKL